MPNICKICFHLQEKGNFFLFDYEQQKNFLLPTFWSRLAGSVAGGGFGLLFSLASFPLVASGLAFASGCLGIEPASLEVGDLVAPRFVRLLFVAVLFG